jgi:hypothetical protein
MILWILLMIGEKLKQKSIHIKSILLGYENVLLRLRKSGEDEKIPKPCEKYSKTKEKLIFLMPKNLKKEKVLSAPRISVNFPSRLFTPLSQLILWRKF